MRQYFDLFHFTLSIRKGMLVLFLRFFQISEEKLLFLLHKTYFVLSWKYHSSIDVCFFTVSVAVSDVNNSHCCPLALHYLLVFHPSEPPLGSIFAASSMSCFTLKSLLMVTSVPSTVPEILKV